MEKRIFKEENNLYQFDFSNAVWATDELNQMYRKISSILSDVDFIAETDQEIIFMEYKNADVENAANPGAFVQKLKSDEHYRSIALKYYGSILYALVSGRNKPYRYVYVLECAAAGSTERLRIRTKIRSKLPFDLQNGQEFSRRLIEDFEILSIEEWNNNPIYGRFPITAIASS
ncbi:hypothetical protein [Paenibacillus puerhi]|uniref:hypothetical protein n=1 Tax=Paenibacillus puerhi TaxID=2692622 RepID=UPI0013567608|nr:hypothetical protein [Paenibacillus puerhi]